MVQRFPQEYHHCADQNVKYLWDREQSKQPYQGYQRIPLSMFGTMDEPRTSCIIAHFRCMF